jgi:hypothetical protein
MNVIVVVLVKTRKKREASRAPAPSHTGRYWEQTRREYPNMLKATVPRIVGFLPILELIKLIALHATMAVGYHGYFARKKSSIRTSKTIKNEKS